MNNDKVKLGARIIFGGLFLLFGLNGLFGFFQTPAPSAEAGALLGALASTGYFFPFVKIVEIIAGALILSGILVPFALALIFPIIVGILQIHLFLDPAGLPIIVVLTAIHAYLTYVHWDYFKSVFVIKAE